MILRRVIAHFKKQEWTAIALDFVIVVMGVGVALIGQQWLGDRQQRADMRVAELALQSDLQANYFFAKERLAVADCRLQAYQAIADQLLAPGEAWIGMPRLPRDQNDTIFNVALHGLLRSPSRNWGSRNWEVGLARGTFNQMKDERRNTLDLIFKQTQHAEDLQREIYTLQGRIKTLSVTTTISQSDRLRYFDMLAEMDDKSALLEIVSGQIITQIEAMGIDVPNEDIPSIPDWQIQLNNRGAAVYGECYVPMEWPVYDRYINQEMTP